MCIKNIFMFKDYYKLKVTHFPLPIVPKEFLFSQFTMCIKNLNVTLVHAEIFEAKFAGSVQSPMTQKSRMKHH